MRPRILANCRPDGDALLKRVSLQIDDEMLLAIAAADAGVHVAEYAAGLRLIRDACVIDRPLRWQPREVLELVRWLEPDAEQPPGRSLEFGGHRGHWMRAFACAALIRAYGDSETRQIEHGGYNTAIIQLLDSLRRLGARLDAEAMSALAWLITRWLDSNEAFMDDEIVFAGVALLSLAVGAKRASDNAIAELANWLVEREARAFAERADAKHKGHWLFRSTHFDMRMVKWTALGVRLTQIGSTRACAPAMRDIGAKLSGAQRMR